jgi:hypothetical protein
MEGHVGQASQEFVRKRGLLEEQMGLQRSADECLLGRDYVS